METELKLSIAPGDVASFRRLALLRQYAAKPFTRKLASTYFDTQDMYLERHGMALRVRRAGRNWIQGLKGRGDTASGLHQRPEWECAVKGPAPDLKALERVIRDDAADPRIRKMLAKGSLADRLIPIFATQVRRTIWQVRPDNGSAIELALDLGQVIHDQLRAPISEIELELKTGDPGDLFDFALQLQLQLLSPLRPGNLSKSQRGYALCRPQAPAAVKAVALQLAPDLNAAQGLQSIIGNCLMQIQGNESGLMEGADPENVHQMRIGLRRLRSALDMFAPVAPCPAILDQEFRWLSEVLGRSRDWDVLGAKTLPAIGTAYPNEPGLKKLRLAASAVAAKNRRLAAAAVDSTRYARLFLMLGKWTQEIGKDSARPPLQQDGPALPEASLSKFAGRLLDRSYGRLKRRGKRLPHISPLRRHKVRIAAKKLRYAAEFFRSLYAERPMRRFLDGLAALQEVLGRLNDAAVAGKLLQQFARDRPARAQGAGFVRGCLAANAENCARGGLVRRWERFERRKPGWK